MPQNHLNYQALLLTFFLIHAYLLTTFLQGFADARKDVIYDFLKREDINWRGVHWQIAKKIYTHHQLNQ